MRIVVCVKWVPALGSLRFDPDTRRLVREGVPGEVSSFDLRALGAAVALRTAHGGEVVALSMGPPGAREGLVECLALGADRALHLLDPRLAGSDTLATARALAAVLTREAPDLVLFGRASTDAETGQVGPEVAEMLDRPQVTGARRLELDPAARSRCAPRTAARSSRSRWVRRGRATASSSVWRSAPTARSVSSTRCSPAPTRSRRRARSLPY